MRAKWEPIVAILIISLVAFLIIPTNAQNKERTFSSQSIHINTNSIFFIENIGQFDSHARFLVRGSKGSLFLSDDSLWYTFSNQPTPTDKRKSAKQDLQSVQKTQNLGSVHLRVSFVAANTQPTIEPINKLDTTFSYFLGNDTSSWHTDVPVWSGVRYKELYPGIDLELGSVNGILRQRIVAHQGANLSAVRMRVEGASSLSLARNSVNVATPLGVIELPLFELDNQGAITPSANALQTHLEGFDISAPFTKGDNQLVSQKVAQTPPTLLFSAFVGGNDGQNDEIVRDIALDQSGDVYLTGYTYSSTFPTKSGFDKSINGGGDAYILKISSTGTIIFGTFIGGSKWEYAYGIAVDSNKNAIITGYTESDSNFPRVNAFQNTFGGVGTCGTAPNQFACADAFITKLNATGNQLVYSTYYGNELDDDGFGIAIDSSNFAYVTGVRVFTQFPRDNSDAFVTKISPSGSNRSVDGGYNIFLSTTNLPANTYDEGDGIVVDSNGAAYIRGYTESVDFYVSNGAYQTSLQGGSDIFFSKIDPSGGTFQYSTYVGGTNADGGWDISLGPLNTVIATGWTDSNDFPAAGQYRGRDDAFILRLNASGSQLDFSTFFGGDFDDDGYKTSVASDGSIYVTGYTYSANFPVTQDALDTTCGNDGNCNYNGSSRFRDAFLTHFDSSGALIYSTFLGGSSYDAGYALALDASDNIYVSGFTVSSDFPVTTGQTKTGQNTTGFLSKIGQPPIPPTLTPTNTEPPTNTVPPTDTPQVPPTNTPTATPTFESRLSAYLPAVLVPLPPTATPTMTQSPTPVPIPPCGDVEDNDDYDIANDLNSLIGSTCYGNIDDPVRFDDFYKVDLKKGQRISASISNFPANVNLDIYLYAKNAPRSNPLVFSSGNDSGIPEAFSNYEIKRDGPYYVVVYIRAINGELPSNSTYNLLVTVN